MQLIPRSLKAFAEGVQDKSHARASNSSPPHRMRATICLKRTRVKWLSAGFGKRDGARSSRTGHARYRS